MTTTISNLSTKEMTAAYNAVADRYEDMKCVRKFASRHVAVTRLKAVLAETGEQVVVLLQAATKRGGAADRFPFYKNGILASQYVEKCVAGGHKAADARRDVRYDNKQGYIQLV